MSNRPSFTEQQVRTLIALRRGRLTRGAGIYHRPETPEHRAFDTPQHTITCLVVRGYVRLDRTGATPIAEITPKGEALLAE